MNSQQAKEILMLYRPGDAESPDPQLVEALAQAKRDPTLARWFEEHCALQAAIRRNLRQISVPRGLKELILAEHLKKIIWWQRPAVLAAAAAIVLLIGLAVFWTPPHEEEGYAGFRERMVSQALRIYRMDLETNDLKQIRAFLASQNAISDYVLPPALDQTPGAGCKILTWQGKRVSMVCFNTGRPLEPGEKSDLFLFIIDRSSLPDPPPVAKPLLAKVNKLMTAGWSSDDKVYVLGGIGDADFIRKYF